MNKILTGIVLSFAAVLLMTSPAKAAGTDHLGPFAGASQDNGSCGIWANDTYNLALSVHDNGNGTFAVRTDYRNGAFVTTGGQSPGGCETANHHGSTVTAGITGNFQGFVGETVTGTYVPTGCDVPGTCTTRSAAIAALFPGGTESFSGFNFEYNSSDHNLQYRHWQDKSDNQGNDQFNGDIATQ